MKYKTKKIVVNIFNQDEQLKCIQNVSTGKTIVVNENVIEFFLEPLEKDKQETFKCDECKKEYVEEVSLQYKNWIFCKNCFNKIKNIKVTLKGEQ